MTGESGFRPIIPDWPAPHRVRAAVTTRGGGGSGGPWRSLNLAEHVGDDLREVWRNRRRTGRRLNLPSEPRWLVQRHGARVASVQDQAPRVADAIVARAPGRVCAVLTADCLPVLLCDRDGGVVAAVHAGWRGIVGGVIESAVAAMEVDPARLLAWLGPAIGREHYEVGHDVRDTALAGDESARAAFRPNGPGKWKASLETLARGRLTRTGVSDIWGGGICTASDPVRFFSHRRDGITGRMAAFVWMI